MGKDTIDTILSGIQALPTSARLLQDLLHALAEPDMDIHRVSDMVAFDPALTAKLLQVCNSALVAGKNPVNDVHDAIARVGFHMVHRVVAAVSVAQLLKPTQKGWGVDPSELWSHSVTTAFGTQFVAADFGAEGGLFFTAGLLHDVGKIILAEAFKEDYARLVAEARQSGKPLFELELAAYGVDHAVVGGRLLARWKFSPELMATVAFHHNPAAAGQFQKFASYVGLADFLAHKFRQDTKAETGSMTEPAAPFSILGSSPDDLTRYSDQIKENIGFVEAMCRLN